MVIISAGNFFFCKKFATSLVFFHNYISKGNNSYSVTAVSYILYFPVTSKQDGGRGLFHVCKPDTDLPSHTAPLPLIILANYFNKCFEHENELYHQLHTMFHEVLNSWENLDSLKA